MKEEMRWEDIDKDQDLWDVLVQYAEAMDKESQEPFCLDLYDSIDIEGKHHD